MCTLDQNRGCSDQATTCASKTPVSLFFQAQSLQSSLISSKMNCSRITPAFVSLNNEHMANELQEEMNSPLLNDSVDAHLDRVQGQTSPLSPRRRNRKKVGKHHHNLAFSRIASHESLSSLGLSPRAVTESMGKESSTYTMDSLPSTNQFTIDRTDVQSDARNNILQKSCMERRKKSLKEFLEKSREAALRESNQRTESISPSTISTRTIRISKKLPLLPIVSTEALSRSVNTPKKAGTDAVFVQLRLEDGKVEYVSMPLLAPFEGRKISPGQRPTKSTSQVQLKVASENVGIKVHRRQQVRVSSTTMAA